MNKGHGAGEWKKRVNKQRRKRLSLFLARKFIEHRDGLVDLSVERSRRLQELDELRVVHLEQHTGDLARKLGLIPAEKNAGKLAFNKRRKRKVTYGAIFMYNTSPSICFCSIADTLASGSELRIDASADAGAPFAAGAGDAVAGCAAAG